MKIISKQADLRKRNTQTIYSLLWDCQWLIDRLALLRCNLWQACIRYFTVQPWVVSDFFCQKYSLKSIDDIFRLLLFRVERIHLLSLLFFSKSFKTYGHITRASSSSDLLIQSTIFLKRGKPWSRKHVLKPAQIA